MVQRTDPGKALTIDSTRTTAMIFIGLGMHELINNIAVAEILKGTSFN